MFDFLLIVIHGKTITVMVVIITNVKVTGIGGSAMVILTVTIMFVA
jgi:hypothetical protein